MSHKIIFSIFLFYCSGFVITDDEIYIKNDFYLCDKTDIIINENDACKMSSELEKLRCVEYKNVFRVLSQYEDEFTHLFISGGESIVYNLNSEVFVTNCSIVKEIWVLSGFKSCTKDLPVFIDKEKTSSAYLTKEGILRHDSKEVACTQDYDVFELSNFELVKQDKFVGGLKKDKKSISISDIKPFISHSISDNSFDKFVKPLTMLYNQYVDNNLVTKTFRDIVLFCLLFFVILLIIILQTKTKPSCEVLKRIIKLFLNNVDDKVGSKMSDVEAVPIEVKRETVDDSIHVVNELESLKKLQKVRSNVNILLDNIIPTKNITVRTLRSKKQAPKASNTIKAIAPPRPTAPNKRAESKTSKHISN